MIYSPKERTTNMTNEKAKNQDAISVEDLHEYLTFVLTNQVKDRKHAKELQRLSRRTVTLSDVVTILKALTQHQDDAIVQLMDKIQIQELVLLRLGATEEIFKEAKEEYADILKAQQEALKAQIEALKAMQEEKADEE